MPILFILLGSAVGAGLTFLGQRLQIIPSGTPEPEPGVTTDGGAVGPVGPVPRSGFLVFPASTDRNQIQGAIFDTKAAADDFARELAAMIPGIPVWRVELKDDRIVENTGFSFGTLRQAG